LAPNVIMVKETTRESRLEIPWVEKYRPKNVDEVAYQEEVVRTLKKSIESGNLPHLLFYGPPGTGKTSTILAVARQLYGPELFRQRVLELNASDERGISVIRNKVKSFAQTTVGGQTSAGYPCPPFKLIILDEADSMTNDAQSALRRTMETYSKITRFCIICNYVSRIIDPITSRCAKFRFRPLHPTTVLARLEHISQQEHIPTTPEGLQELVSTSEGDLRKAITSLQHVSHMSKSITASAVRSLATTVPPEVVEALLHTCRSNSFQLLNDSVTAMIAAAYPVTNLFPQLLDCIMAKPESDVSDTVKSKIAMNIGHADRCIVEGADEYLQLLAVCAFTMDALCS